MNQLENIIITDKEGTVIFSYDSKSEDLICHNDYKIITNNLKSLETDLSKVSYQDLAVELSKREENVTTFLVAQKDNFSLTVETSVQGVIKSETLRKDIQDVSGRITSILVINW